MQGWPSIHPGGTSGYAVGILGRQERNTLEITYHKGFAQEIYLLCTGSFMSLYAANNIAKGIRRLARRGETGLAGVIGNSAGDKGLEQTVLSEFAQRLDTRLVALVPRSPVIQACDVESKTVLEHSPHSTEAKTYRQLAQRILDNTTKVIPTPIEQTEDLERLYRQHLENQ